MTTSANSRSGSAERTGGRRQARTQPLATRASAWLHAHPVASGIGCALLVAGTCAAIFYLNVFSDISSSADFIYSSF